MFSQFEGQFLISSESRPPPKGAVACKLASLSVAVCKSLATTQVVDRSGKLIGLLLGTVIDTDGERLVTERLALEAAIEDVADIDAFIESNIYRYCGSFVFVLDAAGQRRIYLDANGTKSLVYDPVARCAGATTAILLSDAEYRDRFQADLHDAFGIAQDGWFTAGLTAHRGIRRLLCNHYLDLNTWRAVRHWPLVPVVETQSPEQAVAVITDQATRYLRALIRAGKVTLALTGGYDTRLLLACSRTVLPEVSFATVEVPGEQLDIALAKNLAARFGLRHELLPYRPADDAQVEAWRKRTSHGITGANMRMHPSVAPLSGQFFVGGVGGEVGRCFLWLQAEQDTKLDAAGIATRLKMPKHPLILAEIEDWLRPLAHYDTLLKLDLAFMELRVSCWAFCQSYAMPDPIELHPLISRRVYTAMLSVPPSVRRNSGMIRRCIEWTWPELLAVPFNQYGDWRDKLALVRHAMARPDRAYLKIRQLLSS